MLFLIFPDKFIRVRLYTFTHNFLRINKYLSHHVFYNHLNVEFIYINSILTVRKCDIMQIRFKIN